MSSISVQFYLLLDLPGFLITFLPEGLFLLPLDGALEGFFLDGLLGCWRGLFLGFGCFLDVFLCCVFCGLLDGLGCFLLAGRCLLVSATLLLVCFRLLLLLPLCPDCCLCP